MHLNKYKKREKDAINTDRILKELYAKKWLGRWQPCEPFQHGWIRDYVLREDVARRADAQVFRNILAVINTEQWSENREFTYRIRGKGRHNTHPFPVIGLKRIDVHTNKDTGEEEGWPFPEGYSKWFYYHGVNYPWCCCFPQSQYYRNAHYVFKTPWMFEHRIRPAFISKLPMVDGELESQIEKLNQHMYHESLYCCLANIRGYNYREKGYDQRHHFLNTALDRETRQEMLSAEDYHE